jgi:hypothetical protein
VNHDLTIIADSCLLSAWQAANEDMLTCLDILTVQFGASPTSMLRALNSGRQRSCMSLTSIQRWMVSFKALLAVTLKVFTGTPVLGQNLWPVATHSSMAARWAEDKQQQEHEHLGK